ncbi:hypothetical protein [Methylosinus sporium]|uniref:hypothetical protein n=1 Tax=Methylosinus sporium TaxID=428 RepID=UPI00383A3AE7
MRMSLVALALLLLALDPCSATPADKEARRTLIGSWKWSKTFGDNYFIFTFDKSGDLETNLVEPNGLGKGAGEVLGGRGRYRLRRDRLQVERPHVPADGWPSENGPPPYKYDCRIRLASDASAFELFDCPIRGRWERSGP